MSVVTCCCTCTFHIENIHMLDYCRWKQSFTFVSSNRRLKDEWVLYIHPCSVLWQMENEQIDLAGWIHEQCCTTSLHVRFPSKMSTTACISR
ncbi:TPA: hypothetical protein GDO54_018633 [Pyxicephalus adspersus]|uniref:Uncharacterized protein n=1 Tax=Pyxicephalus adspersus TaxID=30357 RepID=A0AAV2ZP95_PYXAD|nr:TPA: hypothetical protein GDO54_018633 [Pyxicephalus adspersus]